jgi:hypothetical protein
LVESRLNQTLSKKVALEVAVHTVGSGMKVDLSSPEACVFLEIIKVRGCFCDIYNVEPL